MKSNLIITPTTGMNREQWLAFRKRGIGASEMGALLGLSPYKSNVELYYEKLGVKSTDTIENIAMFMGTELENYVAKMWQYWEGSESSLIANFRAGKIVRKMQRVNAYVQNAKFPHIFISMDRRINAHIDRETGQQRGNGPLEIKTIGGYESDKWETGIPPSHVVQVQTQTLVGNYKYGELAVLKDGRNFDVYPFEKHPGICREIVKQSTDFWGRVEAGRKFMTQKFEAQNNFNIKRVQEIETELQRLEPDPDGSDSLAKFLKEKYRDAEPKSERSGTDEELNFAREHLQLKEKAKILQEKINLKENTLKTKMKEIERLTFGEYGSVYWKNGTDGTRRFSNKVRPE